MKSKGEWNGSKLPRMVKERGEDVELDDGDINSRMMNWDEREVRKIDRIRGCKRKEVNNILDCEISDGKSDTKESDKERKETSDTEQGKEKKRRLEEEEKTKRDCREVPEVKSNNITSFFPRLTNRQREDDSSSKEEEVDAEMTKSEGDKVIADPEIDTKRIREVERELVKSRYFGSILGEKRERTGKPSSDKKKEGTEEEENDEEEGDPDTSEPTPDHTDKSTATTEVRPNEKPVLEDLEDSRQKTNEESPSSLDMKDIQDEQKQHSENESTGTGQETEKEQQKKRKREEQEGEKTEELEKVRNNE